jgi:ATP-dependent DNA helicase RecQ
MLDLSNPDYPPESDAERRATEILRSVFGFAAFRGQQLAVIEHVVQGGDALVLMPTGGGKSLCFQIPALVRGGRSRNSCAKGRSTCSMSPPNGW